MANKSRRTEESRGEMDELWAEHWQAYMDIMGKENRVPSYANLNEKTLCGWYQRNRHRYLEQKLTEERKKRFCQLLKAKDKLEKRLAEIRKKEHNKRLNKKGAARRLANSPLSKIDSPLVGNSIREVTWNLNCEAYSSFLIEKGYAPLQTNSKKEAKLYRWFSHNKKMLTSGRLPKEKASLFKKLIKLWEKVRQKVSDDRKKEREKKREIERKDRSESIEALWMKHYKEYIDFLKSGRTKPAGGEERAKLKRWFGQNNYLMRNGYLKEGRRKLFQVLLERKQSAKRKTHVKDRGKNENSKIIRNTSNKKFLPQSRISEYVSKAKNKTSQQDLLWDAKLQTYLDYMEVYHRRPSRQRAGDMVLFDWFKHSWKLLKRGLMKPDRTERFQQLVDHIESLRPDRTNLNEILSRDGKENKWREMHDEKKSAKRKTPSKNAISRELSWQKSCENVEKFIEENGFVPKQKSNSRLYQWYIRQRKLFRDGTLPESRQANFAALLDKIEGIKETDNAGSQGKDNTISLYDYQQDMKDRIEKSLKGIRSVMVQMPTGTGKTHVVAAVVKDFIHNNSKGKVWIVAHRRELVKQMKRTLALYLTKDEIKQVLATSIQWLSLHYNTIDEKPSLIVIDEAHHAVAKTYSAVMNAYPKARKLGVTATPYRLSGEGFSELFDTLLTSADIRTFIARKRLCPFDYYVVDNNSEEVNKLLDIKKRGIDGDYQTKELDRKFNDTESIRRLYLSYMKYAKGKKGFVYAISIHHAENIAKYYQEQGLNAMAISSKTPEKERDGMIQDFKKGKIDLLMSCDMLSEGFDYPDAEVIQIARPTLSLAKYMQMVGRGLRMAKGKDYCIIIDNVGLADRFGLPDRERDWKQYFKGFDKNNPTLSEFRPMGIGDFATKKPINDDDIHLVLSHNKQENEISLADQVEVFEDEEGRKGLRYKEGEVIFKCEYKDIEISSYGIVDALSVGNNRLWYDLYNGVVYYDRPVFDYLGGIPVAIVRDCIFPRIRSKWITQKTRISKDNVKNLFDSGLEWFTSSKGNSIKRMEFFIPWNGKLKVYKIVETTDYGARLLEDEEGRQYAQQNLDTELIEVKSVEKELDKLFSSWKQGYSDFVKRAKEYPITYIKVSNLPSCGYTLEKESNGIIEATSPGGSVFWVDTLTRRKFNVKPKAAKKGGAKVLFVDDYVFVRDNKFEQPVQYWQVEADVDGHYWVDSGTHVSSLEDYHVKKMDWWWKN